MSVHLDFITFEKCLMRDLVTEGGKMEFLVENATLELQAKVANSLVIVGLQIKISH